MRSALGAAIDVDPMSPEEAWLLVRTLRQLARRVWDAYGDDLGSPEPPRRARPPRTGIKAT